MCRQADKGRDSAERIGQRAENRGHGAKGREHGAEGREHGAESMGQRFLNWEVGMRKAELGRRNEVKRSWENGRLKAES